MTWTGSVDKARTRDHVRVFTRRVGTVGDDLRIVADPPLIVPIEDLVEPGSAWERSENFVKKPARLRIGAPSASSITAGGVPLRPRRPQGGRSRQRGDPLLHPVAGRA